MANTTINTTVTTASSARFPSKYYDRQLLESAKTRFVHAEFGQKRPIPRNNGKHVNFRRWNLFDPALAQKGLAEGVTPDGQTLSQTDVEATVNQYGAYVEVTDLLDLTAYDSVINDSAELLGEQLGTVIEWVTRDVMCSGTNVQYAGGKSSRSALTASDKLTTEEIRKAVRTLKKNKARPFCDDGRQPHFICICSPEATYDLQNDEMWKNVSTYSNSEAIYSGEIGRLFGVVFVESTEAKVFTNNIHATLVFGKDAYGVIDVEGKGAVQLIVKPHGSSGTADPLDQRATVGAKVTAYTAAVLNDLWLVRIEHTVS